ncbi:exported protein [Staphylococcus aureus]|nr:exported protein [Staphylococcus aureus]
MKKFFFIGLLVFVVFFTAATIIWFSYDKNKYGTKQYDKTFKDDAFDNVSINLDSTELRIKRGNQFRVKSRLLCKMLYNVFTISTYQN